MASRLHLLVPLLATCLGGVCAAAGRAAVDLPVWTVEQPGKDRYLAVHGLRAFAGGYAEDGLEVWTFPLQLVSGYALDIVRPDGESVQGIEVLESAAVDPLSLTRVYRGAGFHIEERMDTRGPLPGVRVRYRVQGPDGLRIRVRMRPSLNLMWPAGTGGQEFGWDADASGFVLREPAGKFRALIASPQATTHTEPNNDRRGSEFGREIQLTLHPQPCGNARCAVLAFAGQSEPDEDAHATATALLRAPSEPAAADVARYDAARWMKITTPDPEANRALQWAQIALEQAWTCNPRLGCGLLAGYGPSHGARRPQYAWYFANDGLVNVRALTHAGAHARAAEKLDFILRYQHPDNGMLWHELSQSAGFIDWVGDYDYMYVHVDIAFEFLAVLAEYVRASGDEAFVRAHWPKVLAAYRYCASTLDAGDGLPRVPADKMAGNEQDPLTDELTLSAAWVLAAEAMAQLARTMDEAELAAQAQAAAERARTGIRARYRDAENARWISGYRRDGRPGESFLAADLAAIASGAATLPEAAATFDRLASPDYLTAWGLRSKPASASDYDPEKYASGSVWALGSATAAEALWRAGRADTAYAVWNGLVPWVDVDAPGHMHEVMSGSAFAPQRESVPEQTWSSASFLSAAIRGMFGLDVDARANSLHFAPQPPAAWPMLRIERIRVGDSVVDLEWRRSGTGATLSVLNHGPPFRLVWTSRGEDGASVTKEQKVPGGSMHLALPLPR